MTTESGSRRAVHPAIGMGAEEVALRLDQIGGQAVAPVAVVVG